MILKEFQQNAVEETAGYIKDFLIKKSQKKTSINKVPEVVLKSPTGSGKTIMAAEILKELADFFEERPYAIIWAAPNKLHEQSKEKLEECLVETEYKLVLVESLESGALTKNTILFANWEKVFRKKDNEWANKAVRRGEDGKNLQDVLDATRAAGIGIVLIVDESHQSFYGPNSQEIVHDVVKPDLVFEISATPKAVMMGGDYHQTEISFSEVADSELIKETIILNNEIAKNIKDSKNAVEVVIDAALEKRSELAERYKKQGVGVNPLLLIQLPNDKEALSDLDLKDKEIIEDMLLKRGYRYSDGNLAIWLSSDKKNLENIKKPNSKVDILIFKQAIALGWDCPRAQVLAMLRDTKSETFRVQTVGRVLRMPEAKHYSDQALNTAYVYTDLPKAEIDKHDEDAKNLIKMQVVYRKDGIKNVELPSVFMHRTDYGDLRADFKPILEDELNRTFGIDGAIKDSKVRNEIIDRKLEISDKELTTPIISDVVIENLDEYEKEEYETVRVKMDEGNIEKVFHLFLRGCTGQYKNWARTKSVICGTLYSWFHKARIEIELVQRLIACSKVNQKIIEEVFDKALDRYDSVNHEEMKKRRDRELEELTFNIPAQDEFNENYKTVDSPNYAMEQYYRKNNAPKTEEKFEKMLNSSDQIEWWYKNGEKMERYFAIQYWERDEHQKTHRKAFYPDYIIRFKDGSIGIYDTKAGFTADNEHVRQKANALQMYIREHQDLGLKGGIVNVKDDLFFLQDSEDYDEDGEWLPFVI